MTEQEQILTKVLDCDRTSLYTQRPDISVDQQLSIDQMTAQLSTGEPLQYILGDCFFFGLSFKVDARCLIPRPETEILVEKAIERLKLMKTLRTLKVLDIGTGSGNIAITIAKNIPECLVLSIDSSKDALDIARVNKKNHQLNDRVFFEHIKMEDFLSLRKENAQKFDLIISNPPYIPTEQL
ncbi:Peptide chain release factor N(5)-glutamine methyltransferase, partial [hydrothermal vent metagenome]